MKRPVVKTTKPHNNKNKTLTTALKQIWFPIHFMYIIVMY